MNNIQSELSKEKRTDLETPIKEAINNLPKGKYPGLGGFPVEFYKEYWHKLYLFERCQERMSSSSNNVSVKMAYKNMEIY